MAADRATNARCLLVSGDQAVSMALDIFEQVMFRERTRVIVPTFVVSAVLLLLSGAAAWYLHRLQRSSSELLAESIAKTQAAEELVIVSQEMEALVDEYLLTRDESHIAAVLQLKEKAGKWLQRAEELADGEEELATVEQVRHGYRACLDRIETLRRSTSQQDPEAIVNELRDLRMRHIVEPAEEYRRFNREQSKHASERNLDLADRMGLALISLGMCGAVAGLLVGFVIARSIDRQLERNRQAAMRSRQLAAMGQLAAGVAHELRNPLTSLKIIVQTAVAGEEKVTIDRRDFDVLGEEIERLNNSIQTFLDYARPPKLEKQRCSALEIVQQTVALLSHRAVTSGVRFQVEAPDGPVEVDGDPAQLKQLFLNLLINAVDASPSGGTVMLTIKHGTTDEIHQRTGRSDREDGQCVIEVADTGEGLPADQADRIFEPFVSTKEAGTGLGLSICRRIVEEHGGSINAANRLEGGAVFIVALPSRYITASTDDSGLQTSDGAVTS